ncbi:MAG: rhomboid family intramembrane serine protease [Myxococcales bacterium]|nr:rhomboid family intramembrane serine protease [Myxococcales bacterium]
MALYENVLVFAAILLALTLLRLIRRRDPAQRGYLVLIVAELTLAALAVVQGDRFIGVVVSLLCGLTVGLPWLLERAARQAFALGRPRAAVRMTGLRALLMPGAGLGRQQQILAGFAVLDRRGPEAALAHYRGLVAEAEDPAELAMIHEQIAAMLLFDLRWAEAITHYESQFQPGYAALRPALALGMLRAYGEVGRLDAAATLLRMLEGGPMGSEPGAASLLAQARLTFLAYAGRHEAVDAAIGGDRGKGHGLSPASAGLLQATAAARAGASERAHALLQALPKLVRAREERTLAAGRALQGRLDREVVTPGEVLVEYARQVELRLREQGSPGRPPPARGLVVTGSLIAAMAAVFAVSLGAGLWGVGLLHAGALTPELWRAGSWGRLLNAPFVHADLLGLLLNCYSIWLGGHVFERIQGHARMGLTALVGAAAGLWAAARFEPAAATMIGGGNAMAVAVLVATLWTLVPTRTPGVSPGVRRSLVVTLLLLVGAQLLACMPGDHALRSTPLALAGAALVGSLIAVALPPNLPRALARVLAALLVGVVGLVVIAGVQVAREDPIGFAIRHREPRPPEHGVTLTLPRSFERVSTAGERRHPLLPVYPGWIDMQALRGGALVQVMVLEGGSSPQSSALIRLDPQLSRELVVREDAGLDAGSRAALAGVEGLSTYTLQRNGVAVGRVIERSFGAVGPTVVLVAAPGEALEQAPRLYAQIVADAARE